VEEPSGESSVRFVCFAAKHICLPCHCCYHLYVITASSQPNNEVDYDDSSITENGRVSYPINHIASYEPSSMGGHPANIIFLTCDAFGVLPPVARLGEGQVNIMRGV
jgi:hypothetical protein